VVMLVLNNFFLVMHRMKLVRLRNLRTYPHFFKKTNLYADIRISNFYQIDDRGFVPRISKIRKNSKTFFARVQIHIFTAYY